MTKYKVRKAKGSRKPWGTKDNSGFALFYDGSRVGPHFRNWWPTKKKADKECREINKSTRGHR